MSVNWRGCCLALSMPAVLLSAAVAPASASASGPVRSVDARSASATWSAERRYLQSELHTMPAATRAVSAYVSTTAQDCPAVLTSLGSLRAAVKQPAVRDVIEEGLGDLGIASNASGRRALAGFQRQITGLRWSRPAIAADVRRYTEATQALYALPASDLCGDARQLVADGGGTEPAPTRAWLQRLLGLSGQADAAGGAFAHDLDHLSGPTDLPQMAEVVELSDRLQARDQRMLQAGLQKLVAALGLPATVHLRSGGLTGRLGS